MRLTFKTIISTITLLRRHGIPSHILVFGQSLGDNLLLTTLAANLFERGHRQIWIKCDQPGLFLNNPHIRLVLPFNSLLSTMILKAFKVKTVFLQYTNYHAETDGDEIPDKHIILKMADLLQISGEIKNKPIFCLAETEKRPDSLKKQVVICTSNTSALVPMRNKEWNIERYQEVVDRFAGEVEIIQLGGASDHALKNVTDLRGKTSIRQTAAILKQSSLLISHVGFMMHFARAVDCRSVIIYGGRERPDQSGYPCFENIYSAVPCSPCWLHNRCDFERKCMQQISAQYIYQAAVAQLELSDVPLLTDFLFNP